MKRTLFFPLRVLRDLWADTRAVTAITITLLVPVLVGLAGFTIDIGHLSLVQKQLQASADAAALAGGYNIPDNTAVTTANTYGGASGKKNALSGGVTATMVSGYPVLRCLTSTGVTCAGTELAGGANAIQVKEQATVPMWFAQILGVSSYTLTATSTASARGGIGQSLNVMIILDTTQSMSGNTDSACGLGSSSSRLDCAEAGVKALLGGLNPSLDYVGLMVFPGLQSTAEASNASTCGQSTSASNLQQYGNAPVYQIAALNNDFKSSNTGTSLNTGSTIAKSIGQGGTGCSSGIAAPGGEGTYFAQVFTQAQAALSALSASQSPPAQNIIVFLSDGGANATKIVTNFNAYIGTCSPTCVASTTLHVTSCQSACANSTTTSQQGPLAAGQTITTGAAANTKIVSQLTGPGEPHIAGRWIVHGWGRRHLPGRHLAKGGLELELDGDGRRRHALAERQQLHGEQERVPADDRRRARGRQCRYLGLFDRLRRRQFDRRLHDRHHLDRFGDHRAAVVLH